MEGATIPATQNIESLVDEQAQLVKFVQEGLEVLLRRTLLLGYNNHAPEDIRRSTRQRLVHTPNLEFLFTLLLTRLETAHHGGLGNLVQQIRDTQVNVVVNVHRVLRQLNHVNVEDVIDASVSVLECDKPRRKGACSPLCWAQKRAT